MRENDELFAFVLIPFNKEFDDIYQLGIKKSCADCNITSTRVDEQIFQESILERIYRQIDAADVIIADLSMQNPNVFYELGYAHAKEKMCIHLIQEKKKIPFDLAHHRHIIYDSITNLNAQLRSEITWVKNEVENIKKNKIKLNVKSTYGDLDTTNKYASKAIINFRIVLTNESSISSEIEAIYLYSSGKWEIYQNKEQCDSTDSDLPDFVTRHFLFPTINRLPKGSWARLNFQCQQYVAYASRGDDLTADYHAKGQVLIRLVTTSTHYDYTINVDVLCCDFPF